ncbi:protein CYTOKININ-RESPONSIVE GATA TRANSCRIPTION FACTOR 1-like [Phragmites australis]|uniref:protein CYTOKININ-RESPONSIVE GATA TRANSCRIPTION FACTOR 1-like n=1 Tax=Phragmites australis TaxID=29695 RepID=UPI002D788CE1|nr:protein CYTOKININ-RESPONSIVE GATA TRANSCRIPTION FACTOR 1-like [Phragmites australis]
MSTIYMSQLSTLPLMEGGQDQGLFPAFHIAKDPPILFPFMINNPVDQHQGQSYGDQHLKQQVLAESSQQFNDHMMMSGSDAFPTPSPFRPTIQSIGSDMIQRSAYDPYDIENKRADGSTSSWPAKMKIVRKAMSEYPEGGAARKPRRRAQAHHDESQQQQQQAIGVIRVCSDCNTTKTPLWRSGPCGPKSLCNACGIRQRKARRAMAAAAAAAAAAGNGGAAAGAAYIDAQGKPAKKEKKADVDRSLPFKKRCKMVVVDRAAAAVKATPAVAAPTKDQDHVADDNVVAATSLQRKGTPPPAMSFHTFPADEITDAAMLLMTLSCGLVSS